MKKITKNIFNEKILDKNSIIYLYGCTEIAEATIQGLKVSGKLVTGVIDKNSDLKPKDLMGVPIFNPTILKSISKDSLFLITCSYFNSVSKKLEEEGFYNIYDCALIIDHAIKENCFPKADDKVLAERMFFALDEKINNFLELNINKKLIITSIDVVVTERCSLNCTDCANLMPYFERPINAEIDNLFFSLDKIMNLVESVNELRVIGGEPFMNKEVHKIIEKCNSYLNAKKIIIYTNATILPRPEQLLSLKNSKVFLEITNYKSLSKKLPDMIELFSKENINFFIKELPDSWDKSADVEKLNRTEEELNFVFKNCCSTYITTLLHGYLYRCPFSASLDALKIINFSDQDRLKITDDLTHEKIKFFINGNKPLDSCNYCRGRGYIFDRADPALQMKGKRKANFSSINI
jgi:organic radical activating enzyme